MEHSQESHECPKTSEVADAPERSKTATPVLGTEFADVVSSLGELMAHRLAPIVHGIGRRLGDFMRENREVIENLPTVLNEIRCVPRQTVTYLAGMGWFVNWRIEPLELVCLVLDRDDRAIEEFMISFARKDAETAIAGLAEHFPHRKAILVEAYEAHKDGKYALSVPVFLAQADGIVYDRLGKYLFMGTEKLAKFAASFELGIIADAMLDAIRSGSSIWQSFAPEHVPSALNRHAVLHGRDVTYATEANSLRCIMLLDYLAAIMAELQPSSQHWGCSAQP